ncbi:hypothetical protein BD410DRAFT_835602 [Rickenella mellea]|uniref:Hypervirulence associated protein TUDOR domain-containing protein n=1 Tax=Rickenella mellea TaxID=50990 RepID=A0A4Y7QIY1_9AGAM|nr:hypothetical protein BD410DRAFT_835602 [Rickenella mellea]
MSAMDAFPAGTKVSFHGANGQSCSGTVQSTSQMSDGTQIAVIKVEGRNDPVQLPVIMVHKDSQ